MDLMNKVRNKKIKCSSYKKLTFIIFLVMAGCLFALRDSFAERMGQDRVFLKMEIEKSQAYIYERVPLTIKLLYYGVSLRDIQYPQIFHEDFEFEEFASPIQKREIQNGRVYEMVEFKTNIFAKKQGDFNIGPAQLQCHLLIGKGERRGPDEKARPESYFGDVETDILKITSERISLKITPLPKKGRPIDFDGAVGNFNFAIEVHPKEAKLGEPITLKMMIEGKGNFHTVRSPRIKKERGFKTYDPQVKMGEGFKIYEQVLIPQSETVREVPKIQFSFFDPEKEEYRTLHGGPLPIKILKMDEPEVRERIKASGLGVRDIIYIKESSGNLRKRGSFYYQNKILLLSLVGPPLIYLFLLFLNNHIERMMTDRIYAGQQKAKKRIRKGIREAEGILKKGDSAGFYHSLFKTLQDYLGNKFYLPPKGITVDVVDETLKSKGMSEELLKKWADLFTECDQVRYASFRFGKKEMENSLVRLKEVVRHLERERE